MHTHNSPIVLVGFWAPIKLNHGLGLSRWVKIPKLKWHRDVYIHTPSSATAVWGAARHFPGLSLSWTRSSLKSLSALRISESMSIFKCRSQFIAFFPEHLPNFPFHIPVSETRLPISSGFEKSLKNSPVLCPKRGLAGYQMDTCFLTGPSPFSSLFSFLYLLTRPAVCL